MLFAGFQKMTNFSKIALVLGIFLTLFMTVSMCYKASDTKEFFKSSEDSLYFFNVDWCGHCKTAKPKWGKFVSMAKQNKNFSRIKFIDANGDDEKNSKLLEEFNVSAYPTIVLQKDGSSIEYDGDRSVEGLVGFMEKHYN
jgi:thiol-disulfide isomerase/thioredoxin